MVAGAAGRRGRQAFMLRLYVGARRKAARRECYMYKAGKALAAEPYPQAICVMAYVIWRA